MSQTNAWRAIVDRADGPHTITIARSAVRPLVDEAERMRRLLDEIHSADVRAHLIALLGTALWDEICEVLSL